MPNIQERLAAPPSPAISSAATSSSTSSSISAEIPRPAIKRVRSLWPKEHGAYGQLGMPLLGALIVAFPPTVASLGYLIAAVSLFLLHEPALVLLGQRGKRAIDEAGERARVRLLSLGGLALAGGVCAVLLARQTLWAAGIGVLLAAIAGVFVWTGREKTAAGELVAASALPWCSVLVGLAGGVPVETALVHWAVWTVAFACATLTIRGMIARGRKRRSSLLPAMLAVGFSLLAAGVALAAWSSGRIGVGPALALVPVVALSLGIGIVAPKTKYLREVGWGVIAATVLTLAVLAATPATPAIASSPPPATPTNLPG